MKENLFDQDAQKDAVSTFDFSQQLAEIWEGSNWEGRRDLLESISLNRTISNATLCLQKRKPFAELAEQREKEIPTGNSRKVEPSPRLLASFLKNFFHSYMPEPLTEHQVSRLSA